MAINRLFQKIQDGRQAAILNPITSIFKLVRDLLSTTLYVKYQKDLREIVDRKAMTQFRVHVHTSTYTCIIAEPSMHRNQKHCCQQRDYAGYFFKSKMATSRQF